MNWKLIGIKNLFIIYTIAILIIGFVPGFLIGEVQGAKILGGILEDIAIESDSPIQNENLFTVGSSTVYYIVEADIELDKELMVNVSDITVQR